jgi:Flp pilus assembly protein TadD
MANFIVLGGALLIAGCTTPNGFGMSQRQINEEAVMRQQVANQDPVADNRGMYLSMIREMQGKGLYFASLAHVDAFEQKYGVAPDVELLRAHGLRESGQAAQAEALYRKLQVSSVAAAASQGLGLVAGARGDFAGAVAALREAARRDPTNALIVSDLGYALLRQGDMASARLSIAQAAELAPTNPKIVGNLALYLLVAGDEGRAEAVMDKAEMPVATRAAVRRLATNLRASEPARATPAVAMATAAPSMSQTPGPVRDAGIPADAGAGPAPRVAAPASVGPAPSMNGADAGGPRAPMPAPDRSLPPEAPMQSLLDRFSSP